jgi:outer membrane protein
VYHQKLFDNIKAKVRVGDENKTNLAAVESSLYKAQFDLLQHQANLESAKASFKTLVGLDPVDVQPVTEPDMPQNIVDFGKKVKAQNWLLLISKYGVAASKAGVGAATSALLPELSAEVALTRTRYKTRDTRYRDDKDFRTTLRLDVPIFTRGGAQYSKIREAKNDSRIKAIGMEQQIQKVDAAIDAYWGNYQSYLSGLKSAASGVEASALAVKSFNNQLNLGLTTLVDVLSYEDKLVQAQMMQAKLNTKYYTQVYYVKSLMGELTAKSMNLNVKYFDPDGEFKKIKLKIVGF